MAKDGISGASVPAAFPFSAFINQLGAYYEVAPCLIAAIKMNETGLGNDPAVLQDGADPATGLLPDGTNAGRGLMQLTSSWPDNWNDPFANLKYAVTHFIQPAWQYWDQYLQGDGLVRAIAASYNAGIGGAQKGHDEGNVDKYTTNDYGARALANYQAFITGTIPGA